MVKNFHFIPPTNYKAATEMTEKMNKLNVQLKTDQKKRYINYFIIF